MACASPGAIGTDRLVASFIEAIQAGDEQLAKDLVVPMSNCHLKLDIKVSPNGYAGQRTKEKVFSVNVHMEDRESSGHVELFVKSADSIADLKRKVWVQRNIPVDAQRWIIGKKFPDDDMTLGKCGVNFTGHTLFLYIVTAPEPKIESEREQNRNDNYENFLASPTFMSNTLSYQEGRKQSDTLLMAPNAQYDTLQKSAPPPIPERVPLQDEYDDSDEQTKVVPYPARRMAPVPPSNNGRSQELWNSLMHVIPPPSQGNRAPQQVEESLGWECPVCTFVNLPTRPGCEMCSEDRPEGYAVPDNYQMTDEEVAMQVQQEELERLTRQPLPDEHDPSSLWLSPESSQSRVPTTTRGPPGVASGIHANPHQSLYQRFLERNTLPDEDSESSSSFVDREESNQTYQFLNESGSSRSSSSPVDFENAAGYGVVVREDEGGEQRNS